MRSKTLTLPELEAAWRAVNDATPETRSLRRWAFREIASGREANVGRATRELNMTPSQIAEALHVSEAAGLMTSRDGVITGSLGLTTERTEHELRLDDHKLHVWCALDAVGIPAALGKRASVKSRTGDSRAPVRLEYDGRTWAPSTDFEITVPLPGVEQCISEEVCPAINFYERGNAPVHPQAAVLSLVDAQKLGVALWGAYA